MYKALRLGAKLGLVGTAVYVSTDYGLWKDSARAEELYKQMYTTAAPYFKEVPLEVPEIPKASEVSLYFKTCWNHAVVASARFLVDLPSKSYNLVGKGMDIIVDQFKDQTKSEDS